MPLLGKKIFDPEIASKTEDCDKSFSVPHTKEAFYSEIEYQKRLKLYQKNIWTCQCTGHINLTHEEAVHSEKECRERLVRFGEVWEKPLLRLVHHSLSPLDNIIAQAYTTFMTKLVPGEKVVFTVAKAGKAFEATVVKGYETKEDDGEECSSADSSLQSTSPSSDKENKSRQALITDVFKTDIRRSQRCSSSVSKLDISAKGKKLKLLPTKYDILLTNENKIVSKVPCEHLKRLSKPPSREQIRFFIRANAVRLYGGKEKFPWLVDEIMVFRHSLTPQISPDEEKRMVRISTITSDEYYKEQEEQKNSSHINGSALSNGTDTSEDEVQFVDEKPLSALLCSKAISDPNPRKRKTNPSNGKAKRPKVSSKSLLAKGKSAHNADKRKQSGMDYFLKKVKKESDSRSSGSPKKNLPCFVVISDHEDSKSQVSSDRVTDSLSKKSNSKSAERSSASSRKNSIPKKKKQATLLELTKKGSVKLMGAPSPSKASKSTGSKPRKPRQPLIVLQLMSLKKEKKMRIHKYKVTIAAACKTLTEKQRENLPPEIKDDVVNKWNLNERKRKFKAMTEEEKRAYLSEQRKAKRKATNDVPLTRHDKFEDQHLVISGSVKSLPEINLVSLPESLPNTSFGDVAMLCEFLHSYHSLLCPKDPNYHKQFNIQSVSDAVTAGKTGFGLTRKILVLLLQTLLADDIAKDYCEIEYPLNEILVTPELACELVRVCLRQHDEELDDVKSESSSNPDVADTGLTDSTSRRLFDMELYEMEPMEQVEVLSTLAYRVMNTYAVQSHMEDTKVKAATIWNKVAKQKKERKQEMKEKELAEKSDAKNTEQAQQVEEKTVETNQEKETSDMDIDLVSRVKKRKMLAEQHRKEEKERKERYRKEQDEIMEKQRNEQERERTSRQLAETRMLAVHVKRRVPLGSDRNHSRYWLFCDGIPGLYIEKGWIGDQIGYHTMCDDDFDAPPPSPVKSPKKSTSAFDLNVNLLKTPTKCFPPTKAASISSDEDELPLSRLSTPSKKKPKFRKSREEATWPRPGQNMWMSVDSQEVLDDLMKSLLRHGVRESKLLDVLKKNYENINRSINKRTLLYDRTNSDGPVRRSALPSDGDELLRAKATKNFQTMIRETCRGGLAEISEPDVFEQRVAMLENVAEFSAMLLELFEAIPKTCLLKYMTGVSNKKKKTVDSPDPEPVSERERMRAERRVARWKRAVEETTLFSRFSLLLAILNNSIDWSMYRYRRVYSRRRGTRNKNYADMNEGEDVEEDQLDSEEEDEDEESEDSDEESDEEEDEGQRRSSRIRQKNRIMKQAEDEIPATRAGARRKRKVQFKAETSDEEEESEEEIDDESDEDDDMDACTSEEEKDVEEAVMDEDDEGFYCRMIVKKLMKFQYAELFRDPVDEEEVPDYYEVIQNPMCLQMMLEKIELAQNEDVAMSGQGFYNFKHLIDDMRLILDNASKYNAEDSYVMKQAGKLEAAFVRLCTNKVNDDQYDYLASQFKGVCQA